MGPAIRTDAAVSYTKFVGWGRRIRTPATWSRATRPTTRRSPTNAPTLPQPPMNAESAGERGSADRRLERAARAEARHLRGRNLNLLAGARVTAVAGCAASDHECPESGNRHAPAAAQRLHDAADEGIHGALSGNLRAPCVLCHDCHQLGLGHLAPRPFSSAAGRRCQ